MPIKRKFIRNKEKYGEAWALTHLVSCLSSAMMSRREKRKTDLVGIACHFAGDARREDFEALKAMTIGDILAIVDGDSPQ